MFMERTGEVISWAKKIQIINVNNSSRQKHSFLLFFVVNSISKIRKWQQLKKKMTAWKGSSRTSMARLIASILNVYSIIFCKWLSATVRELWCADKCQLQSFTHGTLHTHCFKLPTEGSLNKHQVQLPEHSSRKVCKGGAGKRTCLCIPGLRH